MKTRFPLLLRDTDGYMYLVNSENELNNELEKIDIEDNEYLAWDSRDYKCLLYIQDDKIRAKVLSNKPELKIIKEYLLQYALKYKPNFKNKDFVIKENIIKLFHKIENT